MLATMKLDQLPKTTQQAEKLKTKELQNLFNTLLAAIIHSAERENISSKKELSRMTAEIEFVISAIENRNKNSGLKKSTIAIIALNLIELINSWEKLSAEEKAEAISKQKEGIRKYKILYRSSKSKR